MTTHPRPLTSLYVTCSHPENRTGLTHHASALFLYDLVPKNDFYVFYMFIILPKRSDKPLDYIRYVIFLLLTALA